MRYEGVWDALRRMAATEGLPGFYRGMRVKLAQTVLAAALMMSLKEGIYEWTHALMTAPTAAAGGNGRGGGGPRGGGR
jgi:adenine nucleotide transporter 17